MSSYNNISLSLNNNDNYNYNQDAVGLSQKSVNNINIQQSPISNKLIILDNKKEIKHFDNANIELSNEIQNNKYINKDLKETSLDKCELDKEHFYKNSNNKCFFDNSKSNNNTSNCFIDTSIQNKDIVNQNNVLKDQIVKVIDSVKSQLINFNKYIDFAMIKPLSFSTNINRTDNTNTKIMLEYKEKIAKLKQELENLYNINKVQNLENEIIDKKQKICIINKEEKTVVESIEKYEKTINDLETKHGSKQEIELIKNKIAIQKQELKSKKDKLKKQEIAIKEINNKLYLISIKIQKNKDKMTFINNNNKLEDKNKECHSDILYNFNNEELKERINNLENKMKENNMFYKSNINNKQNILNDLISNKELLNTEYKNRARINKINLYKIKEIKRKNNYSKNKNTSTNFKANLNKEDINKKTLNTAYKYVARTKSCKTDNNKNRNNIVLKKDKEIFNIKKNKKSLSKAKLAPLSKNTNSKNILTDSLDNSKDIIENVDNNITKLCIDNVIKYTNFTEDKENQSDNIQIINKINDLKSEIKLALEYS